jgi:transposase
MLFSEHAGSFLRQAALVTYGRHLGVRRHRWVVERSLAWLLGFRRLGMRYERRADLLQGLLHLACTRNCLHVLPPADA